MNGLIFQLFDLARRLFHSNDNEFDVNNSTAEASHPASNKVEPKSPDKSRVKRPNPKADILNPVASLAAMSLDNMANTLTSANKIAEKPKGLPIYTLHEVGQHNDPTDGWIVLYDLVYDVTSFMESVSKTRDIPCYRKYRIDTIYASP